MHRNTYVCLPTDATSYPLTCFFDGFGRGDWQCLARFIEFFGGLVKESEKTIPTFTVFMGGLHHMDPYGWFMIALLTLILMFVGPSSNLPFFHIVVNAILVGGFNSSEKH